MADPAGGGGRRGDRQPDVRLGIGTVRAVGAETAERIAAGRPYASMEDLVRRGTVGRPQLEALATAGALEGVPPRDGTEVPPGGPVGTRRQALWAAGVMAQAMPDRLPGLVTGERAPVLPDLAPLEEVAADMWATGLTVGAGAVELARPRLDALGVIPAGRLLGAETDGRVLVGGVVTHRQHPESAKGTVFLNLEDETGMVNVICSPGAWLRWRDNARRAPALLVRGRLERVDGVVSVVAEKISRLDLGSAPLPPSRDFR
jgi:error-prone DNA polymerase